MAASSINEPQWDILVHGVLPSYTLLTNQLVARAQYYGLDVTTDSILILHNARAIGHT